MDQKANRKSHPVWKMLLPLFLNRDIGDVVSYEEINLILGYNANLRSRGSLVRVKKELELEHCLSLKPLGKEGYEVVPFNLH